MNEHDRELANDLLRGAAEIAEFVYGSRKFRRRIYHLATTNNRFPCFKLGSLLCCRKSVLLKLIEDEEGRHTHATVKQA
jgi:hypothetical protein